jgi:hypothetical protein
MANGGHDYVIQFSALRPLDARLGGELESNYWDPGLAAP